MQAIDEYSFSARGTIGTRPISECLAILSDNCNESGYHFVYKCQRRSGYELRIFKRRINTTYSTARDAAIGVARWWHEWFGDDWPDFFAAKNHHAMRYVRLKNGTYRVIVHLMGEPKEITPKQNRIKSLESARAYARLWVRQRYGMFESLAFLELRRRTPYRFHRRRAFICKE